MKMKITTMMALLAASTAFAGEGWVTHFGTKPQASENAPASAAGAKVALDAGTNLQLGEFAAVAQEFSAALVNSSAVAHEVRLFQGNLGGVGRVQVSLPEGTNLAPGARMEFKVRFDPHGLLPGDVEIPLVFVVDGDEAHPLVLGFQGRVSTASVWASPQRASLTPKRTSTRFEILSPDGAAYDAAALEDAKAPLRVVGASSRANGIEGRVELDPALLPVGSPKRGETRLVVSRQGVQQDAILIQWSVE